MVSQEALDLRVNQGPSDSPDHRARGEHRVTQVPQVSQVVPEPQDLLVLRVHKVLQGLRVREDQLDP